MIDVIPATNISFDKDFAWLVFTGGRPLTGDLPFWKGRDRPCDTCGGDLEQLIVRSGVVRCPAQCIDGRHTFEIRHYQPCSCVGGLHEQGRCEGAWPLTKRVSIVPGMVLPLLDGDIVQAKYPPDGIYRTADEWWRDADFENTVTLPTAAAPGQSWAVQLKVRML